MTDFKEQEHPRNSDGRFIAVPVPGVPGSTQDKLRDQADLAAQERGQEPVETIRSKPDQFQALCMAASERLGFDPGIIDGNAARLSDPGSSASSGPLCGTPPASGAGWDGVTELLGVDITARVVSASAKLAFQHPGTSIPAEIGAVAVASSGGLRVLDPGRLLMIWAGAAPAVRRRHGALHRGRTCPGGRASDHP